MDEKLDLYQVGIGRNCYKHDDTIGWYLKQMGAQEAAASSGDEFEAASAFTSLPAGNSGDLGFETGESDVTVNSMDVSGVVTGATYQVFEGSNYSGGTVVNTYNNNSINPKISDVVVVNAPLVVADGNQLSVTNNIIGLAASVTNFNAKQTFRLKRNTKYIFRFSNTDMLTPIALLNVLLRFTQHA